MNKQEKTIDGSKTIFAVYGTLKRGYGNNHLLRNAKFIGEHTTEPNYTMYGKGCGFPIVGTHGNTAIKCELFETTDPETVRMVDSLEGFRGVKGSPNNWYDRITINTKHGPAEMYVMHNERNSPIVESGEWGK